MVLSSSQQLVLLFITALCLFILLPTLFTGGSTRDNKALHPHFRKGHGPVPSPSQRSSPDSAQQVQRMVEQELRKEKAKVNSNNKGYMFTLMPLYAIAVGLFAAYKFLKIKSADDTHAHKERTIQGLRKSEETENQLNELEQRLAQTEKMLNSIITQLDPLTNCVKSVAIEQKNEIMTQLQCIRHLLKKRGMQHAPTEASCERNLDNLLDSLSAMEALGTETSTKPQTGRERVGGGDENDFNTLSVEEEEEEHEDGVGGATVHDEEMEEHDVCASTEEYDEDLYKEELEENTDDEEGVAKTCPVELGEGLRRRNRHD